MYNVSAEFLTALHKEARFENIKGTIGNSYFKSSDLMSVSFSNRCSDTADVTLGSCYIGQLEATFIPSFNAVTRGDWRGSEITLEWGLKLEDDSWEYIPIGHFTVTEANWSGQGITIKASDNISKLDRACAVTGTSGKIFDFMNLAAQECGLVLAQNEAYFLSLPNGNELFGLYPNSDIKTWRDFVSWVCQLFGGFAYADREGKLAVKSFEDLITVDNLTEREREYQTTFSDYTTKYDGISVVNIEDQTTSYYSNGQGGAVINLGSNPFLQYGSNEVLTRQRLRIADVVEYIAYTPFNSGVLSNMAYDLGDILTCSGGVAGSGTLYCCVMSIDWTSKNLTNLQGYGADPSLVSGKSKTDKIISGLISKTSENEVIFHTFENAQDFELEDDVIEDLLTLRFATINPKIVNIWHEINLDVTADPLGDGVVECQAFYYLDDELISYSPVTTWDNDGLHLLHLMYFIQNLEGGTAHKWNVKLKVKGGTATIDVGDIHASLYGQGLVASDSWDGILDIFDEISLSGHGKATFGTLTENISFDWNDVDKIECADVISLIGHGKATFGTLADQVDIEVIKEIYNIVSEDKLYDIVSEDGLYNLESEE